VRVLVIDSGAAHEVFEVVGQAGGVISVKSAYLFEVGEELSVRIEDGAAASEAVARVRAHVGPEHARVTELEISDRVAVK
jgi:hypothetical protein